MRYHKFSQIISHLNEEEKWVVFKICKENKNIFCKEGQDVRFTNTVKDRIRNTNDPPIITKSYSYPYIYKAEVHSQIQSTYVRSVCNKTKLFTLELTDLDCFGEEKL